MPVKRIFLLLLIVLSNGLYAQKLDGQFKSIDSEKDLSCIFDFAKNIFVDTSGISKNEKTISWGKLEIKGKELIKIYEGIERHDTSTYVSSSKINHQSKMGNVSVKINDESGNPMQANIGFYNAKLEPLSFMMSDKEGTAYAIIYKDLDAAFFVIDFIGYSRIQIPINNLIGNTTDLAVTLKPIATQDTISKTAKYKIKTVSKNGITLLSTDNRELKLIKANIPLID